MSSDTEPLGRSTTSHSRLMHCSDVLWQSWRQIHTILQLLDTPPPILPDYMTVYCLDECFCKVLKLESVLLLQTFSFFFCLIWL